MSVTFAAGAVGAGVTMVAMVAVSCAAPVSIVSLSPAARPFVLVRRTAVAPAVEAALSVVLAGAGVAPAEVTLPAASSAR